MHTCHWDGPPPPVSVTLTPTLYCCARWYRVPQMAAEHSNILSELGVADDDMELEEPVAAAPPEEAMLDQPPPPPARSPSARQGQHGSSNKEPGVVDPHLPPHLQQQQQGVGGERRRREPIQYAPPPLDDRQRDRTPIRPERERCTSKERRQDSRERSRGSPGSERHERAAKVREAVQAFQPPRDKSPPGPFEGGPPDWATPPPPPPRFPNYSHPQLPTMPPGRRLTRTEELLEEALMVWPEKKRRQRFLRQHPEADPVELKRQVEQHSVKRMTEERQYLGASNAHLKAAAEAAAKALSEEQAARKRLQEKLAEEEKQHAATKKAEKRLRGERDTYKEAAKDREAQATAAATAREQAAEALQQAEQYRQERDRAVAGGVMLAGALHHQAMLNSLWQQQQVHDQWEYRSLKNWCFKKGYAMRDAPNNRPNFYSPPLEPFFPWPHAMLQSGVTFEEATGHPRTLFGDAGLGGINVEGTRAALLAYEPNPATLCPTTSARALTPMCS